MLQLPRAWTLGPTDPFKLDTIYYIRSSQDCCHLKEVYRAAICLHLGTQGYLWVRGVAY